MYEEVTTITDPTEDAITTSAPVTVTREKDLRYLSIESRCIFFVIFTIILLVAVIGNILAIKATIKRKHRFIQKILIISLSISDIFTASAYAINHLETFSHDLVNWTMGSFMCGFIPLAQICGVIISSALLVAIGIDRYNNVINAMNQRWDPSPIYCILSICLLCIISIALSSPMLTFFEIKYLRVIFLSEDETVPLYIEKMEFCLTDAKGDLIIYYSCMMVIIFLPMMCIFLWLYWNIAHLVWIHRKPIFGRYKQNSESSTTAETASTQLKSMQSTPSDTNASVTPKGKQKRSIHVERKIRTFKIIVFIMSIFLLCRLPYWILNVVKLSVSMVGERQWIIVYAINALNLLNSALNPFIYTFLNPTLKVIKRIGKSVGDFISQICCCCCTNSEFEQFEYEEPKNPFMVDLNKKHDEQRKSKRSSKVQFNNDPKEKY